ncbi:MAG: methylenetetrahydrofolate reductase [NAD(P)H] [Acidimicrobiaceae bacterium]|nr:methylenetetrahydrofolate reductase [NAD(P)H] [Acidimicrobiaceae bacterium]
MVKIADLLANGPTFSFEFFPPKTDAAQLTLLDTIAELEPLHPSFVSVTYGAGGSTRERTRDLVTWVHRDTSITPMAHLTCIGHTKPEIDEIITTYLANGIDNILALGGDPSTDTDQARPTDFVYAMDLVEHLRAKASLSIGVAAHPEMHPRSPDRNSDRKYLARKLRIADFAITQFFFEVDHYVQLVEELADIGVYTPIIPGIMPVTNKSQVQRMSQLSGAAFPQWLADRLADVDDPDEVQRIGIDTATELCAQLLEVGAPGLHFYTLNRSMATRQIYDNLGLANA